jgi:preprotein translocase subunit SecF
MFTIFTDTHINFMSKRRLFYVFSIAATLIGIVSIIAHGGMRMGIDFAGGRLIELRLSEHVPVSELRSVANAAGFPTAEIQSVQESNDVLIRIPLGPEAEGSGVSISDQLRTAITREHPGLTAELLREESIGAKIGKEIGQQAFWAILISLGLLLIYIGFRFEPRFALGAVVAVAHDVFFIITYFSVFNREITMPVVAALLTIAGYSINDTIVVFDRVREQLVRLRREPFDRVLDISINQTLSRTIITGATTLFTSLSLALFGGEVIHDFAVAMSIGIIVGTYSSVFVASALALELRRAAEARAKA